MIPTHVVQITSGVESAAAAASDDKREIFASVLVAILQPRAPHHDGIVQERAVAFPDALHAFDHIGELLDIERRDRGDFPHLLRVLRVVRLGMMRVLESEFRIRHAVRSRTDVGADARGVRLERQHVQVTHHLHILAAFVAQRNLDFDRRGIRRVTFARADARFLQRRLLLPELNGGNPALHGAHAVEVFVQLVPVALRQRAPQVFRPAEHEVQHLAIQCLRLGRAGRFPTRPRLVRRSEEAIEHAARIGLSWHGLRGGAIAAVRVIPLVQPLLVLLVGLRHGGQLQRRQGCEMAHVVRRDLVGRDRNRNLTPPIRIREPRGQPGG